MTKLYHRAALDGNFQEDLKATIPGVGLRFPVPATLKGLSASGRVERTHPSPAVLC